MLYKETGLERQRWTPSLYKIVQKLAFCFLISSSQPKLVIDLPRHWIMALTLSGLKHTDAENDFCMDNDLKLVLTRCFWRRHRSRALPPCISISLTVFC